MGGAHSIDTTPLQTKACACSPLTCATTSSSTLLSSHLSYHLPYLRQGKAIVTRGVRVSSTFQDQMPDKWKPGVAPQAPKASEMTKDMPTTMLLTPRLLSTGAEEHPSHHGQDRGRRYYMKEIIVRDTVPSIILIHGDSFAYIYPSPSSPKIEDTVVALREI